MTFILETGIVKVDDSSPYLFCREGKFVMTFKDYFSGHASSYEQYRPSYPQSFFSVLKSISPGAQRALDVATGNGQAAIGLSHYFAEVLGIDASNEQIKSARTCSVDTPEGQKRVTFDKDGVGDPNVEKEAWECVRAKG